MPQNNNHKIKINENDFVEKWKGKKVKILNQKHPEFIKDILPCFQPLFMLIFVFGIYFSTGNMVLGAWILYIGTPLYNKFILCDEYNLAPANEQAFAQSIWFIIPMHLYVFAQTIAWLFCLMLFSTKWKSDHWMFQ